MIASPQRKNNEEDRGSIFLGSPTTSYQKPQWRRKRSQASAPPTPATPTAPSASAAGGGDDDSASSGGAVAASSSAASRASGPPEASLSDFPLPPARPAQHPIPHQRSQRRPSQPIRAATAGALPPLPPLPGQSSSPPASSPSTGQGRRSARSLSHDAGASLASAKSAAAAAARKPLPPLKDHPPPKQYPPLKETRSSSTSATHPALTQRLRNRSQSQSQSQTPPLPGASSSSEKHRRSGSTRNQSSRGKRNGVSGGFLVGLGGYDASEFRQYVSSPATTPAADGEMAPAVRVPSKQKAPPGPGSSLIFGPPRSGTDTSVATLASLSTASAGLGSNGAAGMHSSADLAAGGAGPRLRTGSLSTAGTSIASPLNPHAAAMPPPAPVFKHEGGRRWLRDTTLAYPLPVDLEELHRQSLRLVMMMRLFGAPFLNKQLLVQAAAAEASGDPESPVRSRSVSVDPKHSKATKRGSAQHQHQQQQAPPPAPRTAAGKRPLKVLEVGCGTGLWSSACHDYLTRRGVKGAQFTGLDVAPVAPDLRKQGVNWRFVQWDVRRLPWPFEDGEFDLIFLKDVSFLLGAEHTSALTPMPETTRLLRIGGVVEIWESDHVFRTLLPAPQLPPGTSPDDAKQAELAGAHVINPSTPFAPPQNRFLADLNAWITEALEGRGLASTPCAVAEWAVRADPDAYADVGSWRLALPFDETRWERQAGRALSEAQRGLRRAALLTTLQLVGGMEPLLRRSSGKRQDEWNRWWTAGLRDLLEDKGAAGGECLEFGAWWATRG